MHREFLILLMPLTLLATGVYAQKELEESKAKPETAQTKEVENEVKATELSE